ncbi:uncharacterized protein PGTG_22350 [Puccinia graminis f. sp. tritici CRL 75-36-700-3]|uniref:Uncharacterized protein n=1 Tax=Puccinia graminis f. sp. tritici (strain CRL 75-36-700-3 / race SCCL) TaxID=418459 RepID=H6QU55_PUCGT|nr:uncharacterized protein PGTG_22350 [Puccinia graminis f. sp. tritici CRL 75-36-700-3]EHS64469.1 hypothetical protein PGTG_22350 [Puccinia graminis f. sp. tritici CRL 75-36-700-3]
MAAKTSTALSRVLCEETQTQSAQPNLQNSAPMLSKSPRFAAIAVDYVLYVELSKDGLLSQQKALAPIKWERIVPSPLPAPFQANIVSFTWPRFQYEVLIHMANKCDILQRFMIKNHDAGNLVWLASIKNHADFGVAVKIDGPADFLNFSQAAYEAYPASVAFKITMANPIQKANDAALQATRSCFPARPPICGKHGAP